MGAMCWIVAACAVLELLVWLKYGISQQMFTARAPPTVIYSWVISLSVVLLWAVYYYAIRGGTDSRSPRKKLN